jgi:hypothetical protein
MKLFTGQTGRVLLAAGNVTASAQVVQDLETECFSNPVRSLTKGNVCEAKGDRWLFAELAAVEESGCAFSVVSTAIPVAFSETVGKATKNLAKKTAAKPIFETRPLAHANADAARLGYVPGEAEWRRTRDLTGQSPIPPGMELNLMMPGIGAGRRVISQTVDMSTLPRSTRNLVTGLKAKSNALAENAHERMALVVEYTDGTSKAVKLTSKDLAGVTSVESLRWVWYFSQYQNDCEGHTHPHPP